MIKSLKSSLFSFSSSINDQRVVSNSLSCFGSSVGAHRGILTIRQRQREFAKPWCNKLLLFEAKYKDLKLRKNLLNGASERFSDPVLKRLISYECTNSGFIKFDAPRRNALRAMCVLTDGLILHGKTNLLSSLFLTNFQAICWTFCGQCNIHINRNRLVKHVHRNSETADLVLFVLLLGYRPLPKSLLISGPFRRLFKLKSREAKEVVRRIDFNKYQTGVKGIRSLNLLRVSFLFKLVCENHFCAQISEFKLCLSGGILQEDFLFNLRGRITRKTSLWTPEFYLGIKSEIVSERLLSN